MNVWPQGHIASDDLLGRGCSRGASLETHRRGSLTTIVAKLHQDAVAAVERTEVRGEDPALRFEGGTVSVAVEAARGVRLGRHGAEHLSVLNKAAALERARSLAPLLADMKLRGMSSRAIAAELTTLGIATPSGGRWHPQTVMRALSRAEGTTA